MTVASTWSNRPTVDGFVMQAYQLAGLADVYESVTSPEWPERGAYGRARLDMIVKELAGVGFSARHVVFYDLPLTARVGLYTLPDEYIDVVGDGMYIQASQVNETNAHGELVVSKMGREDWQRFSSKDAEAVPTRYFVDHGTTGDQLSVRLWPLPSEAGKIRFQVQREWRDSTDGSTTIDVDAQWMLALSYALAADLAMANALPSGRVALLHGKAMDLRQDAVMQSNQHKPSSVYIDHRTGWSGGRHR